MNTKFVKLLFTTGLCVLFLTLLTSVASAQPKLNNYFGSFSTYNGVIAPLGSLVDIYDRDGVFCGRDTIAELPGIGKYGFLPIADDDLTSAEVGQILTFTLNDRPAITTGDPTWDGVAYPPKEVNLEAEGIVSADFTTPNDQSATAGEVVHYSVMVENTGNGLDFFTIMAESSNGWIVNYADGFQYIKSGDMMMLDIELLIPPSTLATTDQLEFTITSALDNSVTVTGNVLTTISEATDVDSDGDTILPSGFELHQNYPNPFNPATTIAYDLPARSVVNLYIYDMLGRKVNTYALGSKSAGNHSFTFEAKALSSGVYFYKVETNEFSAMKRMMLLK